MNDGRSIRGNLLGGDRRRIRDFAHDEDGMVTIFAGFMIFCMVMIGGIGVDMMRHEMERVRLQAIADRAVLAAADLDQELAPEAVVNDYFAKSGAADAISGIVVDQGLNFRRVTVDAEMTMNTQFMDYLGVETLRVPALSTAEEKINKVEISLVLDISGSMRHNSKMQNMKDAANTFIDTVLRQDTGNQISINLVPYSAHVNIGPDILNLLNVNPVNPRHDYSHCVEIQDQEFDKTGLNDERNYFQMQHFQWKLYSGEAPGVKNTLYDTVCPRYSYERIIPLSKDAEFIKSQINQFKPRTQTSIFLGMKWGVALLDPNTNDIVSSLAGQGVVDSEFSNRPAAYSDEETLKTVVLMTDGVNTQSRRIRQPYYNSASEVLHWSRYNLQYYLNNYVSPRHRDRFYEVHYTAAQGDLLLNNICEAAKAEGIIIWAIAFEATEHSENVMRNCASSPSHFFSPEGTEISDSFSSIARQINQLRLIN
ncbi:pilus assembly protein TadG-related protein [Marimonas sp. MJW-29]|uniref:Pilus assembly protein TadG-related protein n=1 Tax=Sulfitobacter sediminis TaxID=3234186 RepID=A0ABV3RT17_9RHOB